MATNPKLPDYPNIPPRKPVDDHTKVRTIRQSKFPWTIVAIIIGAALLIAVIGFFPKGPRKVTAPAGAQIPPQPTAAQVEFTNVELEPSPAGGALYLKAMLHNAGDTAITGVQVGARFLGADGKSAGNTIGKVEGVTGGTTAEDLTKAPIQPNESRPVRIYFPQVPSGWNHEMPALTVTTVTGTTP
jgi:hypothetical protein